MKFERNSNLLIITLDPRIDATNADAVGEEIFKNLEGIKDVQVCATDLTYISSAGLRVLLKLRKEFNKRVLMYDVSKEVYEILEVTGFTELLDVRKSLRRLSVEGCEVIGAGGFGTVYRLDEETILKVYHPGIGLDFIDREREASKKAFVLGIPTAIAYDTVQVGEQFGVVYEMLNARTVAQLISQDESRLEELGVLSANALKEFHKIEPEPNTFPRQKDKYFAWLEKVKKYISEEDAQKIKDFLNAIPDRETFIHGDYNSKNVMVQDGQITLIDIGDASTGHPAFDLAAVVTAYIILPEAPQTEENKLKFLGFDPKLGPKMWGVFCSTYFGNSDPAFIQEVVEMILPFTNLNVAYIGFSQGELSEEQAQEIARVYISDILINSIDNAKPLNF